MKNKILALFIAFTICFLSSSFGFCDGYSNLVSAATTDFVLPEQNFYYGVNQQSIDNLIQSVYDNNTSVSSAGYTPDNSYYFLSYSSSTYNLYLVKVGNLSLNNTYKISNHSYPLAIFSEFLYLTGSGSQLVSSTAQLKQSVQSGNYTTWGCADYGTNPYGYSRYIVVPFSYSSSANAYSTSDNDRNWGVSFGSKYIPPFVRSDYTLYGLDLAINETSFYEWIIENNKLSELPSYITQSKLLSFIEFYNDFGGSFKNFLVNIPDWFSHMNIVNQTSENVNILKSSMDRLYQEYLNSFWREVGKGNAELLPHHRRNIQTQTTDDDLTLVTDDNTDTLDISILRDILRGIIQVSNQIGDGTNSIINKLDQLDFTVNLSNGGGTLTDLSVLYEYDINDFGDDFETFEENVSTITAVPLSYVQTINNNTLMPENMLSDKQNLSVTIPVINGFTVNEDCTEYETNTDTFTFNSTDYPWLDTIVKKMKRFASIMLIIGYLIHLRFKIADIVRGE